MTVEQRISWDGFQIYHAEVFVHPLHWASVGPCFIPLEGDMVHLMSNTEARSHHRVLALLTSRPRMQYYAAA